MTVFHHAGGFAHVKIINAPNSGADELLTNGKSQAPDKDWLAKSIHLTQRLKSHFRGNSE